MVPKIIRTQEEINEVLNRCSDAEADDDTTYPGMTYEQGARYMYNWLTDKAADPMFD